MGVMAEKKTEVFLQVKHLGVLTTIPFILLLGPVIGFFLGTWIDQKTGTYPWFTAIFILLGFVASGRETARLIKQILKETDKK